MINLLPAGRPLARMAVIVVAGQFVTAPASGVAGAFRRGQANIAVTAKTTSVAAS